MPVELALVIFKLAILKDCCFDQAVKAIPVPLHFVQQVVNSDLYKDKLKERDLSALFVLFHGNINVDHLIPTVQELAQQNQWTGVLNYAGILSQLGDTISAFLGDLVLQATGADKLKLFYIYFRYSIR